MKHYSERNIMELDRQGGYYLRHASAMTGEGLHEKCDIAAELGHRDLVIDDLCEAVIDLLNALPSATTHPAIKAAKSALGKARGES